MSRKDYVKFAEMLRIKANVARNELDYAIKQFVDSATESEKLETLRDIDRAEAKFKEVESMVSEIADTFASDNSSFNRDRFFAAVYPKDLGK